MPMALGSLLIPGWPTYPALRVSLVSHDAVSSHRGTVRRHSSLATSETTCPPAGTAPTTEVVVTNVADHQRRSWAKVSPCWRGGKL